MKQKTDADLERKLKAKAHTLEEALKSFGIMSEVVNITHGPSITRFELTLETGTKVSRVTALQDDIMLAMAAVSIRLSYLGGRRKSFAPVRNDRHPSRGRHTGNSKV